MIKLARPPCKHGKQRAVCEDPECVVAEVLEAPEHWPGFFVHKARPETPRTCPMCKAGIPARQAAP